MSEQSEQNNNDGQSQAMTRTLISIIFSLILGTGVGVASYEHAPAVLAGSVQDGAQPGQRQFSATESSAIHFGATQSTTTRATASQFSATQASATQGPATQAETPARATKRLTIEVTGGDKNAPVENASVYLKFWEGRALRKDKKYALNVKTNREGVARIPDPPEGKVLIQIVADGWKSYGKYYELGDAEADIKIHLDRPPKWY